MRRWSILKSIKELKSQVFTTHDLSLISGKSVSAVTQSLNNLVREGLVVKIYRGVWAWEWSETVSPYAVIPYLFPRDRAYVSFISALHLHGIIEQIPQVTTLASTAHAKAIRTKVGAFSAHRIAPSFFTGFGWYKGNGSFLIAEPEKALVDSLYLSAYKKKRFGSFPELHFPDSFSFKKAKVWVNNIPSQTTRAHVKKLLENITKHANVKE